MMNREPENLISPLVMRRVPLPESFFRENLDPEPLWPLHVQEQAPTGVASIGVAAAVGLAFGLLCAAGHLLKYNILHVATFWPADGFLVAYLLTQSRNRWWMPVLAAGLGDAISILFRGGSLRMSGALMLCNLAEVLVAALLLSNALGHQQGRQKERQRDQYADLASPAFMIRFLVYAIVLAPAVSALLGSGWYHFALGTPYWSMVAKWFPPHALGMAVMTPCTLAIWNPSPRKMFDRERLMPTAGMFLLVLVASILVFEAPFSLRFLWLPLLMLVVFEAGILGALLATFEILIVATFFTLRGHGPLWMEKGATLQGSVFLLQSAILVLLVSIMPFAAILERQRDLRKRLLHGMQRYRLLADNSRDIVVLSTLEGHRLYVSPAVQDVTGWTPEEWTNQNSVELMHPDDVGPFQSILQEMSHGEDRRIFRYRTRHKNGRYCWMEASIRSLPDSISGMPNFFVANIREISQRVDAEQKLEAAYQQMQEQAQKDSLTGLANRRRFDDGLDMEWRRARRTGRSLAMMMVDIDHFKRINDTFGHRAGDHCLQAVATTLRQMARRPSDVIARYGGEEFAVLLPDVDLATARTMAEGLCSNVRGMLIDAGIGHMLTLTISVGVAAQVPDKNMRADLLVETADIALYAAKQAGRNCVMPAYDGGEASMTFPYRVQ